MGNVTELSNPLSGIVAWTVSEVGVGPASTRQEATSVAPFQLANTAVESPVASSRALATGGDSGWPLQLKRKAR